MNARSVLLALASALFACGGRAEIAAEATTPAIHHEPIGAELDVVARFAEHLRTECPNEPLELTRGQRSNQVIETLPPITEIGWSLEVCGDQLEFVLDCSPRPGLGTVCRAHGWPPVLRYPDRSPLGRSLEAVAALAESTGPCDDRWCDPAHCTAPAIRIQVHADRFDVERCGVARDVLVSCPDNSGGCSARFDPPID